CGERWGACTPPYEAGRGIVLARRTVAQDNSFVAKPAPASNGAMNFTALAGLLSLAAAMGIGRFAFTPLLPLMLREGQLDVAAGGWIAAANYVGYFAGAMSAARVPLSVP